MKDGPDTIRVSASDEVDNEIAADEEGDEVDESPFRSPRLLLLPSIMCLCDCG